MEEWIKMEKRKGIIDKINDLFDNERFQKVVGWVVFIMLIGISIGSVIGYIIRWLI